MRTFNLILVGALSLIFLACGGSKPTTLQISGIEKVRVKEECFAAKDLDTYDKMVTASVKKDAVTINQLVKNGSLVQLQVGTQVEVLILGSVTKVKLVNGSTWFVSKEFIEVYHEN